MKGGSNCTFCISCLIKKALFELLLTWFIVSKEAEANAYPLLTASRLSNENCRNTCSLLAMVKQESFVLHGFLDYINTLGSQE